MHTTRFNFRDLRILVLVDDILVDTFVHQAMDFGLFPGLAECGEVLARVAVQHQFIVDHRIGVPGIELGVGKLVLGHG